MKKGNSILRHFCYRNLWLLVLNALMLAAAGVVRTAGVGNVGRITGQMESGNINALLRIAGISIALISLSYVLRWAAGGLCMGLSNKLAAGLRVRLAAHLEVWDFQQYESREKGSLHSILTNDVNTATQVIYILHSRILTNVFVYLTSAFYLLRLDPVMGTVIILVSLFLGVLNHIILARIKEQEKVSRAALGDITNTVQHAFAGIDTIRCYHGQDLIKDAFAKGKRRYNSSRLNAEAVDSWRLTFYNIISNTAFFATMFFLGAKGIRGEMELETLLSFLMILRQIMTPVEVILRWMTSLARCDVCWKRIYDVLEEPAEPQEDHGRIPETAQRIELRDLGFAYGDNPPVFRNLNIAVGKGRIRLLKGPSGSGKTTLTKLLLGLYHGDSGRLYVDGKEKPLGQLGQSAAFSEADCPVFNISIYENLQMGNGSVTRERCAALFHELGFGDWLRSLPQGLDTVLDEGGRNISGGQRQILSVMRAILADRPLLVLDEPFSALDREHADILCAYLEKLKETKLILLISHREELYQSGYAVTEL